MSNTKKMSRIAILSAVLVSLALVSNYVTIGTVNINLALIPIVIGACLYGPLVGFVLGMLDGFIIIFAPSTLALFMTHNPFFTIVLCLLKTGIGGLVSGYIYRFLKNKNDALAVLLAAIALPIINTLIFILGVVLFFIPVYMNLAGGKNVITYIFISTFTTNFLIEFLVNIVLSSSIHRVIKFKSNKN